MPVVHNSYKERADDRAAAGKIGCFGWLCWMFIMGAGIQHISSYGILLVMAGVAILALIIARRADYYSGGKLSAKLNQGQAQQQSARPTGPKPYLEQLPPPRSTTPEPPGWYQDPKWPNCRRYWDGSHWTAHVDHTKGEGDAA